MSNAYPGHQDGTVKHRRKDSTGNSATLDVPFPSVVKQYNKFMGVLIKVTNSLAITGFLAKQKDIFIVFISTSGM